MNNKKIYFQKILDNAVIPTKNEEDAGYDIYACIGTMEEIIIKPGERVRIYTGIATAFDKKYVALIRERGSTGSICLSVRAGVVDSGYRGEWLLFFNNTSNKDIIINHEVDEVTEMFGTICYPAKKAVAQFILTRAYHLESEVVDDITQFDSIRGDGKLGDSWK